MLLLFSVITNPMNIPYAKYAWKLYVESTLKVYLGNLKKFTIILSVRKSDNVRIKYLV